MSAPCGCCEGTHAVTPATTANRPGLPALAYRVGTHATFLETMKARLSAIAGPLLGLKTRTGDDPAIAWLDAWAIVGDVLSFYQERIANEGFLRTATERRSILELARLIGYALRPGVASTVYLAYQVDEDRTVTPPQRVAVTIPAGARAQSVPGPDELPQSFETAEPLDARSDWNALEPRRTKPLKVTLDDAQLIPDLYFEGTTLGLKPNDRLLLVFGDGLDRRVIRTVNDATPRQAERRTDVTLKPVPILVIAAVRLLRVALKELEAQIERHEKKTPEDKDLVKAMERLRDIVVLPVLETLLLDHYPPVEGEFLSHDRLYALLRGREKASLQLADSLTPTVTRLMARETGEGQLAFDAKFRNDAALVAVAKAVVAEAVHLLLKDTRFQPELTCLAIDVVANARPVSTADRDALSPILVKFSDSDNEKAATEVRRLLTVASTGLSAKAGEQLPQSAQPLVDAAKSLLHVEALHRNVEGLLVDLLELDPPASPFHSLLTDALNGVKEIAADQHVDCGSGTPPRTSQGQLLAPLLKAPSIPPPNAAALPRDFGRSFVASGDAAPQLTIGLRPELRETFYVALARATVTPSPELESVHVFRLVASLFGNNAPLKMSLHPPGQGEEFPVLRPDGDWKVNDPSFQPQEESARVVFLDAAYDAIAVGSYVVIHHRFFPRLAAQVESVLTRPRTAYALSGKTTQLGISRAWWDPDTAPMTEIRTTTVFAQSEKLVIAEAPFTDDVSGETIEFGRLYDGLTDGRRLIVSGERTDVEGTSGVVASELVMLANVEQKFDPTLPGDKTLTVITLAEKLGYAYKRDTVTIYANVAKATHGETRNEVLGSGDGSKALQQFALRQPPLTYLPAITPSGAESTLQVRVDDVLWHEAADFAALGLTDRKYVTKTDDDGKTTVVFGTGERGARLPTGQENVKAVYRNGIGRSGNVRAGQVSLLMTRPLGVKGVTNPLRASGGADKESRDRARENAPLAVTALDRLVSTQDYADFARTFAGIGKASATRLSDRTREIVHLTIAGADDIPIDRTSDLYRSLFETLLQFGDPHQPIQVDLRELLALAISASVRVLPDYRWDLVEPKIRAALLGDFGFARRALGQDAVLSEVISAIQRVEGVAYVDVDVFDGIPSVNRDTGLPITPEEIAQFISKLVANKTSPKPRVRARLAEARNGTIYPAQLALLLPDVPVAFVLNEVKP